MKQYDTLNRLYRGAPQLLPKNQRRLLLQPRDIGWFSFLHRHGGRLPTSYLYQLTKETHTNLQRASERMKDLARNGYLTRPFQQFETADPEYNELVHELTPKAIEVLKAEGLYSERVPSPHGAFKHQVMLSCLTSSFELGAKDRGFAFIPQHKLGDPVITIDGDRVAPDGIFMLKIDGKELLVFLEVDRGTEATSSENLNRKSWKRSIKQYKRLIRDGLYKEHFGVTCGALLLVVTISDAKVSGIKKVIADELGACNYVLLHSIPEFGRIFHPPKIIDILSVKWKREGHGDFSFWG